MEGILCRPCHAELPANQDACLRCAAALPVSAGVAVCGRCQRHPPPVTRTVAAFRYLSPVDHLIRRFKFEHKLALAPVFAEAMAAALPRHAQLPECLIPVPLHPQRLQSRGYNQALELARPLGQKLGLQVDFNVVGRVRVTASQSELPADKRRGNVRGAFVARRPVPYRHVAIIDDVMTTGNTVHELAKALRRAGVETVEAWVCAKSVPPT